MNKPDQPPEPELVWERGWDGHEIAQMRRLAQLSFREKLRWLEQAHRIVMQLQAAREKQQR